MPGCVERVTDEAHRLVASGDLAAAERALAEALSNVDAHRATASPTLADAAGLRARVLVALGEPGAARAWAAYANAASRRLYGRDDARTVRAAATLAAVLHRVGSHARAAHVYREVVAQLSTIEGDTAEYTLAARADLATVLHERGECGHARAMLARAWRDHRAAYGEGHPAGIKMLARLGAMARDCGDLGTARRLLAHAGSLSHSHLPPGHPMAGQVAALAAAPAAPGHACRDHRVAALSPPPPPAPPPAPPDDADDADGRPGPHRQRSRLPALVDRPLFDASAWARRRPRTLTVAVATALVLAVGTGVALAARHGTEVGSRSAADTPATAGTPSGTGTEGTGTDGTDGPATAASPSPTAAVPEPPTRLRLRDGRDRVTLTWEYPAGADGPVLVSGGREGQPRRAFQTLDAGTTSYTVYGLADRSDYCFSVAVVYSTDLARSSAAACTDRSP